jgi:hypothetical protein
MALCLKVSTTVSKISSFLQSCSYWHCCSMLPPKPDYLLKSPEPSDLHSYGYLMLDQTLYNSQFLCKADTYDYFIPVFDLKELSFQEFLL